MSQNRKKVPSSPRPARRDVRARLRAEGLRPVQVWARDTRSPAFRDEARRQSRAVADAQSEAEDQAFVDSVAERWPE